jgi:hypothetical protein
MPHGTTELLNIYFIIEKIGRLLVFLLDRGKSKSRKNNRIREQ